MQSNLRKLEVRLERMNPKLLGFLTDKQSIEDSHKIFEKLAKYHVSYCIRLQKPEINVDFPEVLPYSLQFHPKSAKTVEKPKKRVSLEAEAKLITGELSVESKRKSRFSGSYNFEESFKKAVKVEKDVPVRKRLNSGSSAGSRSNKRGSESTDSIKMLIKRIRTSPATNSTSRYNSSSSDSSDSESASKNEMFLTESTMEMQNERLKKLYQPVPPPVVEETKLSKPKAEVPKTAAKEFKPRLVIEPSKLKSRTFKPVVNTANSTSRYNSSSSDSSDSESASKNGMFLTKSTMEMRDESLKKLYQPVQPSVTEQTKLTKPKAEILKAAAKELKQMPDIEQTKLSKPKAEVPKAAAKEFKPPPVIEPSKLDSVVNTANSNSRYNSSSSDSSDSESASKNEIFLTKSTMEMRNESLKKLYQPVPPPVVEETKLSKPKAEVPKAAAKEFKPRPIIEQTKLSKPKAEAPKAAAKEFKPPPVIEPPKLNPRTFKPVGNTAKKVKKLPKDDNGLKALGGIFAINNGWEKTEEKKKVLNNFTIPKVHPRVQPQPKLAKDNFEDDVEEAHNVYFNQDFSVGTKSFQEEEKRVEARSDKFNRVFRAGMISFRKEEEPQIEARRDKFNRGSRDSESDEDDDVVISTLKKNSMFSDSDDEPADENKDELGGSESLQSEPEHKETIIEQATAQPEKAEVVDSKDSKSSSDEDEEPPSKHPQSDEESESEETRNQQNAENQVETQVERTVDDEDYENIFLINADPDELEDSEEEYVPPASCKPKAETKREPPTPEVSYTTELDDLRMKVRKEILIDIPESTAAAEFDKNTNEIMTNMLKKPENTELLKKFDDHTERVFKKFFNGICLAAFDDYCEGNCGLNHIPPAICVVRKLFTGSTIKEIDEAYGVTVKYQKMFERFCGLFVEMFIKLLPNNYETKIARIIMDCEKTPKTHEMYRSVVQSLVVHASMPRYKAIRMIINHHTDSKIAQEVIISLILDTNADLVRFMDYLSQVHSKRSIPIPTLDKIIKNCVCYQSPVLPAFCLDNLIGLQPAQLRNINEESLAKFMDMQLILIQSNEERISKAAVLAQNSKILQQNRSNTSGT